MSKPVGTKDKKRGAKKGIKPKQRKQVDRYINSNQWVSSPQQNMFMQKWISPDSPTFGNIYQSALSAGYSDEYAKRIASADTANKWISDYVNKRDIDYEHINQKLISMITGDIDSKSKDDTRLKAIELLAKLKGLMVEKKEIKQQVITVSLGDTEATGDVLEGEEV